ncbi:glycosyltransferase family 4 protein, partial [Candidatus Babeliales bacterium]|nr:glycosyltransferase family 4 protein [Candidatus Babeliales bacterium]
AVICVGRVNDEEKKTWLNKATLMLITSYQEGLGIIGLEAMAHGVPVITTRCGGPVDYVIDGQNGFLVNVDDVEAMAKCAEAILNNPALQKDFVNNGFKIIKTKFSLNVVHRTFGTNLIKIWPELGSVVSSV